MCPRPPTLPCGSACQRRHRRPRHCSPIQAGEHKGLAFDYVRLINQKCLAALLTFKGSQFLGKQKCNYRIFPGPIFNDFRINRPLQHQEFWKLQHSSKPPPVIRPPQGVAVWTSSSPEAPPRLEVSLKGGHHRTVSVLIDADRGQRQGFQLIRKKSSREQRLSSTHKLKGDQCKHATKKSAPTSHKKHCTALTLYLKVLRSNLKTPQWTSDKYQTITPCLILFPQDGRLQLKRSRGWVAQAFQAAEQTWL